MGLDVAQVIASPPRQCHPVKRREFGFRGEDLVHLPHKISQRRLLRPATPDWTLVAPPFAIYDPPPGDEPLSYRRRRLAGAAAHRLEQRR